MSRCRSAHPATGPEPISSGCKGSLRDLQPACGPTALHHRRQASAPTTVPRCMEWRRDLRRRAKPGRWPDPPCTNGARPDPTTGPRCKGCAAIFVVAPNPAIGSARPAPTAPGPTPPPAHVARGGAAIFVVAPNPAVGPTRLAPPAPGPTAPPSHVARGGAAIFVVAPNPAVGPTRPAPTAPGPTPPPSHVARGGAAIFAVVPNPAVGPTCAAPPAPRPDPPTSRGAWACCARSPRGPGAPRAEACSPAGQLRPAVRTVAANAPATAPNFPHCFGSADPRGARDRCAHSRRRRGPPLVARDLGQKFAPPRGQPPPPPPATAPQRRHQIGSPILGVPNPRGAQSSGCIASLRVRLADVLPAREDARPARQQHIGPKYGGHENDLHLRSSLSKCHSL
jgi:hypothetical protein